MFVRLRFSVPIKNFHSYGDVTITSEGLQFRPILGTHCHWAMSSLACHTYCDTGHTSMWSSSSTCETHTCCQAYLAVELPQSVFTTKFCRRFQHPTFPMLGERSDLLPLTPMQYLTQWVKKKNIINRILMSYNIFSYAKSLRRNEYRFLWVYFLFCFLFYLLQFLTYHKEYFINNIWKLLLVWWIKLRRYKGSMLARRVYK